jgi:hypothetical protein
MRPRTRMAKWLASDGGTTATVTLAPFIHDEHVLCVGAGGVCVPRACFAPWAHAFRDIVHSV